jgi:hypothetical protein
MGPSELMQIVADVLESLEVPYLITGSMATVAYGEPRFTNDVDIVVDLPLAKLDAFCSAFSAPEYYCSRDAVRHAVEQRFQFNIIHPTSGLKVDVMIPETTDFNRSRLSRAVRMPSGADGSVWFASAEDVIVKKLEYYREGGSEKHLRDIVGVLKIQRESIDRHYITEWTARLNLTAEWETVLTREKAV